MLFNKIKYSLTNETGGVTVEMMVGICVTLGCAVALSALINAIKNHEGKSNTFFSTLVNKGES